jgi:hypothetical protein
MKCAKLFRLTVVKDLLTFSEGARAGESSMDESLGGASLSFADRVLRELGCRLAGGQFGGKDVAKDLETRLLERVEHRIAAAPAERDAAFRLRCEAYRGRTAFSSAPTLTLTVPASSPSMWVVVIHAPGASS